MNSNEIILLNFSEIRRRSIKLWSGIPNEYLNWKPDENAFTIIEMIRHVLEGEYLFHKIIENRGNLGDYKSPWEKLKYSDLKNELAFSETYRTEFLRMINGLKESDLENVRIERKEVGQSKKLGDYLNRIVYHESVHTGQMLSYLRTIGIERPQIWD
ncbi:DinB family protein [Polaribacter litorisediminis]|uniref:DinB family protein n=1 Tax=Polaribacter litorisediminis TaxID=1908341 RepID=UPI001CBCD5D6|nr:DinB family protein [Polaribacter litorisediminis]UAM99063.1 DinB family protein [Polaribacter litorisediminis]